MSFLILIHVLSAIIGIGPTFYAHALTRKKQSPEELRYSFKKMHTLEFFPKIGGTIAVLTGLLLVIIGSYGSFLQIWQIGALILYILIQIIVIGIIAPINKKLTAWLQDPANRDASSLPSEQQQWLNKVDNLFYAATGCGTLLFILMILGSRGII
ncbi:MAG: hypothetical protein K0R75_1362 [Paenibacillaceae bacterium]|jgi:hypothetical protein|nr:hypothetical protein [Paenibacillaceae bacterium]